MIGRERLIAAARGGEVDRRPVICWPHACEDSDAGVGKGRPDQISLAPVLNPFGRALRSGIPVGEMLAEDPDGGEKALSSLVDATRAEISGTLSTGADGVLYLLYGARGLHTTPMEYGGHYLECDRAILTEFEDAAFNMIFVVGEDDAYLDFVSDLPAHAFGWDCAATGTTVGQMREMRSGALATNSPEADIELRFGTESLAAELELELQETNAV